jgi:hypothetical protein
VIEPGLLLSTLAQQRGFGDGTILHSLLGSRSPQLHIPLSEEEYLANIVIGYGAQ